MADNEPNRMYLYFQLQLRMLKRQIVDFGLHPFVGLLLAPLIFLALSYSFFYKMPDGAWLYAMIGLASLSQLSNVDRTDFLRLCFSRNDFYRVRLVENGIVIVPFVLFLGSKAHWLAAAVLVSLALLFAVIRYGKRLNFTMPTPFFKHPFEYLVGFRSYWLLLAAAYVLAGIAISVQNFNLGLFTLLLLLFCGMSFFSAIEQIHFVWIFSLNAREFLWYKIRAMIWQTLVLCSPILLALTYFFAQYWVLIWVILGFGIVLILLAIVVKYSSFPKSISLPQAIIVGLSIALPPMLLLVVPIFYRKALHNLKDILE